MNFEEIKKERVLKTQKLLSQIREIVDRYSEEIAKLNIEVLEQEEIDWLYYAKKYLDIIYDALEEVYSITLDFIRNTYNIEPTDEEIKEEDIEKLTYKKDNLTLKQRVVNHCKEYKKNRPSKEELLYDFMKILNTESLCIMNNLILNKVKKEYDYVAIEGSNCCELCNEYIEAGPFLEDEVEEPPYHPNCECIPIPFSSSEIED